MNIANIVCRSLGVIYHAKTFHTVCRFRTNLVSIWTTRGYPFNEISDVQFYRKVKYANLVEWNSILTLSYHATRSWSLCLYFLQCCFLLDAVRENYSYISHTTFHFICTWPRTISTISSWLEHKRNSFICCIIQQKTRGIHKICLWLERILKSSHKECGYFYTIYSTKIRETHNRPSQLC